MKLCVVIPVFNEAATIREVVAGVLRHGLDVAVVDDGSRDGSGTVAAAAGARVIVNPQRHGKGYSLKEGFAFARGEGYDGVITMDGDGQHSPDDLELFRDKISADPQAVVNGNRMANVRSMPPVRLATNRLMSWLISLICRQRVPDSQCGFRYIPAGALARMTLSADSYEIESEVLIQASRLGVRIVSVPVSTIYRNEESKVNPVKDTVRFFVFLLRELFRRK